MVEEFERAGHSDARDLAAVARETLQYGHDWFYGQHKKPMYSKEGAEKFLLSILSLGKPAPPDGANGDNREKFAIAGGDASQRAEPFKSYIDRVAPSSEVLEQQNQALMAAPLDEAEPEAEPARNGTEPYQEFRVTGTMLNPSQVYAKDAKGNDKRVIVGNSANFLPGMMVKAVPHPQHPGFFLLHGPLPRFKGRW